MEIITNCPLCETEKSLQIIDGQISQCLNCGYVTTDKFKGNRSTCEEYSKLPESMQEMAIEHGDQIWIPTVMTLPNGMLNPIMVEENMFWAFSPAIDIPEEDKENYPDGQGGFYDKKYNESETKLYKHFGQALTKISEQYKTKSTELKLPKLHKL